MFKRLHQWWQSFRPDPLPEHLEKGRWAEKRAEKHLRQQGLQFTARNVRGSRGEIDLIFYQNAMLIFVEVRYRQDGQGLASVDKRKQQRIIRTANEYLQQHKQTRMMIRFDVVAVSGDKTQPYLEWTEDAFRA
jgi:putative endonuclease